MRLAKYLLALALTLAPMSALANTVTIPNTFQNGQFIDANLFNQNFQSIATFANGNIDNTNIGVAGFYASQIKPTISAQAIFGGTVVYSFPAGLNINGAVLQANSGLTVVGTTNLAATVFSVPPTMSGANINANTIPNGALVTTPITTLTAGSNITLTGSAPNITISAASGAAGVTSVTASGNLASSGGVTPNITISGSPAFSGVVTAAGYGIVYPGFGNATIGSDLSGGVNFQIAPVSPANGFRFFSNGAGTLNNLFQINTTGITASVPISTTGNISSTSGNISASGTVSGATVSSNAYFLGGQANQTLNTDGTTVYFHSVGNGISFVNAANSAFAPVSALKVTSDSFWFGGQANAVLESSGNPIGTNLHSTGSVILLLNGPGSGYSPVSGGVYTNASDRRLKRDITPYTRGLDTIMALRPVHFVWRADSKKSMGFIAQDVQKVLPELVTSTKLKGKATLGVNYSGIIAPLVAAVQEQQREIVELRAEAKALRQAK